MEESDAKPVRIVVFAVPYNKREILHQTAFFNDRLAHGKIGQGHSHAGQANIFCLPYNNRLGVKVWAALKGSDIPVKNYRPKWRLRSCTASAEGTNVMITDGRATTRPSIFRHCGRHVGPCLKRGCVCGRSAVLWPTLRTSGCWERAIRTTAEIG